MFDPYMIIAFDETHGEGAFLRFMGYLVGISLVAALAMAPFLS